MSDSGLYAERYWLLTTSFVYFLRLPPKIWPLMRLTDSLAPTMAIGMVTLLVTG